MATDNPILEAVSNDMNAAFAEYAQNVLAARVQLQEKLLVLANTMEGEARSGSLSPDEARMLQKAILGCRDLAAMALIAPAESLIR